MAEIDEEMLKERLYKVSKALFCIGETCVDASKKHISESDALNKIRSYLNDAHMWSRFEVDQLIEDCIKQSDNNVFEASTRNGYVYFFTTNPEDLKQPKTDANRIKEAVDRTKKYMRK